MSAISLISLPEDEPAVTSASINTADAEVFVRPSSHPPTSQQLAFLRGLISSPSHLALVARAGTGKSTTIRMGVDAYLHAFPRAEVLVVAYNKAIADEMGAALKSAGWEWRQAQASTLHALGFSLLKSALNLTRDNIDEKKVGKLVDARADLNTPLSSFYRFHRRAIIALVGFAKQAALGFFPDKSIDSPNVWAELADHFGLDLDIESDLEHVIRCAQEVYRLSLADVTTIDFDDMILLPLIKNIRVRWTKDLVMVDEYQDLGRARQALALKFLRPGSGRFVMVGDPMQAIYGFSGAETRALDDAIEQLGAEIFPLTMTWRCPRVVVELARKLVPDFQCGDGAPEGRIVVQPALTTRAEWGRSLSCIFDTNPLPDGTRAPRIQCPDCWGAGQKGDEVFCERCRGTGGITAVDSQIQRVFLDDLSPEPGADAILCRNTAPLIPLAYRLIRSGIPAKVEGRKIGEGLQALASRWQVRTTSALLSKLDDYRARETQRATARGDEAKAAEISDRVDTLVEIIQEVNRRGRNDVESVLRFIDQLFADGATGAVTLATYHRAKGREWRRVILWEHASRCPSRAARQKWQLEQESNLAYVSFTRAKETLVFVG